MPNKGLSIPRTELLYCLLLSKIVSAVVNAMSVEVVVSKTVCWTDSLVALWWIKRADMEGLGGKESYKI